MTTKQLLDQLKGLLKRLEDDATFSLYDSFFAASNDCAAEDEGSDWGQKPKREFRYSTSEVSFNVGIVNMGFCRSLLPKDIDEEEEWEEQYAELYR